MTNASNNRRTFLRRGGTGVAAALAVPKLAALASNPQSCSGVYTCSMAERGVSGTLCGNR